MTTASPGAEPLTDALRAGTLWITTALTVHEGRAAREHTVHDTAGTPLLTAHTTTWSREITVRHPNDPGGVVLVIRRRRAFPLTGLADVIDATRPRELGTLHRDGRVRDATGIVVGRFTDARSLRRRTAEGLIEGLGTAIVGGDDSGPVGTNAYVYTSGSEVVGHLVREKLPFTLPEPSQASTPWSRLGRFIPRLGRFAPQRWRERVADRMRPSGWRLERTMPAPDEDPRLSVAGAIFTVELNRW